MANKVLVVDDEEVNRSFLSEALKTLGYEAVVAENGRKALSLIEKQAEPFDIVISDIQMPEMDGLELLSNCKDSFPDIYFLMVTAHGSIETAIKAIRLGAVDYLQKPIELGELEHRLDRIKNQVRLEKKASILEKQNQQLLGKSTVIAVSAKMKELVEAVKQVAQTDANVLLNGESGVGKEVIARLIHESSKRKKSPYIAVNCSAIPENLAESEFFGHEKGAFTGADQRMIGFFEQADRGTIFLDEIGEMDLRLQPKFLRVLEERRVRRVAGGQDIPVDFRLIAATNRDLAQMVQEGTFRQDLFYRLNVVQFVIPPLRDRLDDLPELVKYFVTKHSQNMNVSEPNVKSDYVDALSSYSFPGNIRELSNIVERSVIFVKSGELGVGQLPFDVKTNSSPVSVAKSRTPTSSSVVTQGGDMATQVADFEKAVIEKSIVDNDNNIEDVARSLNVSRSTLYSKMSKYGIKGK